MIYLWRTIRTMNVNTSGEQISDQRELCVSELCGRFGVTEDSVRMALSRAYKSKGEKFSFDKYAVLSASDYQIAFGSIKTRKQTKPITKTAAAPITFEHNKTKNSTTTTAAAVKKEWFTRDQILIFTVAAPTIASVHNMYRVSDTIMGNMVDAVALTVVLSCTGLAMVYTGIRNWPGVLLTSLVILYESFANTVRIYQGMWVNGNPGRFLGSVCDIFGSGSHYTAIALGVIVSAIIALTQYIVFFQLRRDA